MPASKRRRNDASAKLAKRTLRSPAPQGIRLVALGFLEDARAASEKLKRAPDPRALHDFRVAIRRLRSWLRSFRGELDGATRRKDRRALHDIAAATNRGRDVDVQLDWLRGASRGLNLKRRRGADWMNQYLTTRQAVAGDPVNAALLRKFSRVRKDLGRRLASFELPVKTTKPMPTLASAIAARLATHLAALDDALANVHAVTDEEKAHKARIAAKRLRYLLEPAAPHVKHGPDVLRMLKSLQDELGALHDAHVLGHELHAAMESLATTSGAPRGELATLGRRLGAEAKRSFDHVRRDWRGDRYVRFRKQVASFAHRLDESHGPPPPK
jgi:CHAD domain-containing protein